jgi:4-alpha-glucanotransferase
MLSMTSRVRLVLAIHNHQPIGNFDSVFEDAYRDSYAPFLDVLEEYPEIPISLHTSGSLLEWLADAHPEYIDKLRSLVERGQVEILGGPFYEPILAGIPRRDRIGQISAYSHYLQLMFGTPVRGMWVPERVWEQSFAGDIMQAGIEYTVLDDFHFRGAGLGDDDLYGYYITEDEGKLLKIFPGSERLRYTIPFRDPQETIDYLGDIANRLHNPVVVFGDDGEKFGTWPGTKKHVYQDGWLRRFFDALRSNADWLQVATMAEAVDHVAPQGRIYIPDSSYREMTEWALPTLRQVEFHELTHQQRDHDPDWNRLRQFAGGGFWRNFRVKYPEANEMYARVLQVSRRLEELSRTEIGLENPDRINQARTELYRAECNCSYWHGAFGGLYLPHLRNAVYHHLIAADSLLETLSGRTGRWVSIEADDFDLDARKEIRLSGDRLVAFLAPGGGGHLYELDVRGTKHNLLATLNRRPEAYHEKVREAGRNMHEQENGEVASIHDLVRFKQPDLDKKIVYDQWPRKSLVDHFLQPGLTLENFQKCEGGVGDFVQGVYETVLRRSDQRVEARMSREGHVGPNRVKVTKTVALDTASGGALEILYELENLPPHVPIHFAVEFNFAGMAAGASDRYFYDAEGRQLGQLETVNDCPPTERIGLIDEWMGLDVAVDFSTPAALWTFPIQTISQSEGGFELVHQSAAVVPHWEFTVPEDGRWSVQLTLSTDTSAAQARQLREAAAIG